MAAIAPKTNKTDAFEKELKHRMGRYSANPCFEVLGNNFLCVKGDTQLITKESITTIENALGQEIEIWNGEKWAKVKPFKTGENVKLLRVTFKDGSYLDTTPNHKFLVKHRFQNDWSEVEAKDLMSFSKYGIQTKPFRIEHTEGNSVDLKYAYTLGVMVGDGSHDGKTNSLCLWGNKKELPVLGNKSKEETYAGYAVTCRRVTGLSFLNTSVIKGLKTSAEAFDALFSWNKESILHFIAGYLDADGTNTSSGTVRLYVSGYERAYKVYLLLLKCGIRSTICHVAKKGQVTNYGTRKEDMYGLHITDCAAIPCHRLDTSRGHTPKHKGLYQIIKSVEPLEGLHDTYCFEEPETHQGVFGGTLTKQCNLSEVHLSQISSLDFEAQKKAFKAAALIVCSLLHHKFTIEKFRYSREIDPIVGVSFTGVFDFFVNAFGEDWLLWWKEGRPKSWRPINHSSSNDDSIYEEDVPLHAKADFKPVFNYLSDWFTWKEQQYLSSWKEWVAETVVEYCTRHNLRTPNRYTLVQPAGCLDKDAVRVFDQGLLYADEVVAPGSGETKNIGLSVRRGISTRSAIANQPLNLVKVTLNNGRIIRMTPDHKLMIDGSWVQALEMKPGMLIEHSLGEYSKAEEPLLLSLDQYLYSREHRAEQQGHCGGVLAKTITTPTAMSEPLAYFLGALFGNGCVSENKYRVRFSHGRLDVLQRLSQISLDLFGIKGSIQACPSKAQHELAIASRQLYDWLRQNNLSKTSKSKDLDRIPEVIRRSSKYSILSFFAGLIDTDGSPRRKSFSIDLASEPFIRCIQQIGECLGLCFGVSHNTQGSTFQDTKDMWTAHLYRTASHPDAVNYLNAVSLKLKERPVELSCNVRSKHPFQIRQIEFESTPDYSYDFAVDGVDYDDSWYWQGGLKSHNSKSLLTGASPGFHPPKATRYIRRITFGRDHPVALACLQYGYRIIPSQSDKDEEGRLLDDPYDPRCTEWLVEIPVEMPWANLADKVQADPNRFSALAQFDFYMQIQKYYATHTVSATLEFRKEEIKEFSQAVYAAIQKDSGYVSAAMMARFDCHQSHPRLPFEPISKENYEELIQMVLYRRVSDDFKALVEQALQNQSKKDYNLFEGPAQCDSDKCLL